MNILKCFEHTGFSEPHVLSGDKIAGLLPKLYTREFEKTRKGKNNSQTCYTIKPITENKFTLETSYFVGVDWVEEGETAIYIAPKLNNDTQEVDFVKMLLSAARHPEVMSEMTNLFQIKWDEPKIEIEQKDDLLTPFLIMEFLAIVKTIVRKGLKKSYYTVEQNLHSKVRGKVLVSKTIKHNHVQNKQLNTYCQFQEFGWNNKENRLLKKALEFIKQYLPNYTTLTGNLDLQNLFNYINPAFAHVSSQIELNEIRQQKTNAFYKEYKPAMHLAKLILKRFGYNISNTSQEKIKTPPYWIDMTKLFELHVLGLLKDRFSHQVLYQYSPNRGNELDYILKTDNYKMVIDAKYKKVYLNGSDRLDMRQVSGYARLKDIYRYFYDDEDYNKIIDCLIIHYDQENGVESFEAVDLVANEIPDYYKLFKVAVKLPVISRSN